MIACYGLFWREDYVFWGAPKNPGKLFGVLSSRAGSSMVDFREQTGVYILYSDYKIIYVGQAGNGNQKLFLRLRNHRKDALAKRWNQFSWFGTRWVKGDFELANVVQTIHSPKRTVLDHLEAVLISAAEPSLNRQGGKWGRTVGQYLQLRDERLGPDPESMVREVWFQTKKEGT
jgi:hypothetical protein